MRVILYFGHLGCTKKAGEYLKNILKDADLYDGNCLKKVDLSIYDTLIFGVNIRMAKLNKHFIKFIKKFQKKKMNLSMHAYLIAADKNSRSTYIHMARNLLPSDSIVIFAGGELDSTNAKGLSKAVIDRCIAQLKAEDLDLPKLDYQALEAFAEELEENKIPIS